MKTRDSRAGWARGAGAKLSIISGVAFEAIASPPPTRKQSGRALLKVKKDREGAVGQEGDIVAALRLTPADDGARMAAVLWPPDDSDVRDVEAELRQRQDKRARLDRIRQVVKDKPFELTRTQLVSEAGGNKEANHKAVAELLLADELAELEVDRQEGGGTRKRTVLGPADGRVPTDPTRFVL